MEFLNVASLPRINVTEGSSAHHCHAGSLAWSTALQRVVYNDGSKWTSLARYTELAPMMGDSVTQAGNSATQAANSSTAATNSASAASASAASALAAQSAIAASIATENAKVRYAQIQVPTALIIALTPRTVDIVWQVNGVNTPFADASYRIEYTAEIINPAPINISTYVNNIVFSNKTAAGIRVQYNQLISVGTVPIYLNLTARRV